MSISCPSCGKSVDTSAVQVCPSCGWQFNLQGKTGKSIIVRPANRPKIQCQVDIAITIDRTGSSKQFEIGIPKTIEMILNLINGKAKTVKVWLQSHGDLDYGEPMILHTDGGEPDIAIIDAGKIVFAGGGDPDEHHLDAIERLVQTVPWSADPLKHRGAVIAFTTADSKPSTSGASIAEIAQELRNRNLFLYLISENTPKMDELVKKSGGLIFPITNNPSQTELQQIAAQVAASITVQMGSSGTLPMVA